MSENQEALTVDYSMVSALRAWLRDPHAAPPGANDWTNTTRADSVPVVLVHGTHVSMLLNWNALSPLLANHGHQVFAFNYGGMRLGRVGGTGDMYRSAHDLAAFVERVRAATGATAVDLVGHSQGGPLIRYYLHFLGGARYARRVVGLSPTYHGSTVWGLDSALAWLRQRLPHLYKLIESVDIAPMQQLRSSDFIGQFNAVDDTIPGVQYTTIISRYDMVVTPYTAAFLDGPGTENITIQDRYPGSRANHWSMAYNRDVLAEIIHALQPSEGYAASA